MKDKSTYENTVGLNPGKIKQSTQETTISMCERNKQTKNTEE